MPNVSVVSTLSSDSALVVVDYLPSLVVQGTLILTKQLAVGYGQLSGTLQLYLQSAVDVEAVFSCFNSTAQFTSVQVDLLQLPKQSVHCRASLFSP